MELARPWSPRVFIGTYLTQPVGLGSYGFGPSALKTCHVPRFRETLENSYWRKMRVIDRVLVPPYQAWVSVAGSFAALTSRAMVLSKKHGPA